MQKKRRIRQLGRKLCFIQFLLLLLLLIGGCKSQLQVTSLPEPRPIKKELDRMGYAIQVGAFSNVDNAIRLTESLNKQGLNAYYFLHESGLYKVRFGDFSLKKDAHQQAKNLASSKIIKEFYIVNPESYAVARKESYGEQYLREELIATAESFIGLPYSWSSSSPADGFDCSGLAMAVYQLNGLILPRTSKEQYEAGIPVSWNQLRRGDLVFFTTSQGKDVSHVGIYAGNNTFIHAPGKDKKIRTESLTSRYFKNRYVGARTYIK
ncbi:MAG: C40 family peptidase [Candidatus Aminicenantaceae bacterium]